jgi:molybdopterin/thiamine biosynthesis adenylyltransferase
MSVINVAMLLEKCVTVIGLGGGANLVRNLVRCGVRRLKLCDMDTVSKENICRQEHMADQIGMPKADALAAELRRINPDVEVEIFNRNFCDLSDAEIDLHFGATDVFVFCVDNLAASARGNELVRRLGRAAVWSGLYPRGGGGEVVFWRPGIPWCYRCLCAARYAAAERGQLPPTPSDGADILSIQLLDSIAAMLVIGLLTAGSDDRYGRLIEQLGDRSFLQIKIDPAWTIRGVDPVAKYLGLPEAIDTYAGFCTVARRDPDGGRLPCPDCARFPDRMLSGPEKTPILIHPEMAS